MHTEDWDRLSALFAQAVRLPPEQRARLLDAACADAPAIRRELEGLLEMDACGPSDALARPLEAALASWAAQATFLPGHVLSHYRIQALMGTGGMGIVYKALDLRLGRTVALKFLPPHLSAHAPAKQRFMHEAQAASALDHPNVGTIFEIDTTPQGHLFIAMAYYPGGTLKDRLADSPLSVDEAVGYALQVAAGLARAHEAGIVHRDIKPANLMLTSRGALKIVDFGIAKGLDHHLTASGVLVGTAAYMSPEQARGAAVDGRTDLWSLGVLLYEMLTGERPFTGDTQLALMYALVHEEAEPPGRRRAGIPPMLDRIVATCLAKDPDARYADAEALAAELRTLQAQPSPSSTTQPAAMEESRAGLRWPRYVVLATLLALVIGAAYAFRGGFPGSFRAEAPAAAVHRLAVLPFTNVRQDPAFDFLGFALADQIIAGLSYVQSVTVRPSSVVRPYQDQAVDVLTAGARLKVDYLLTGTYLKEDGTVRLTIELIDVQRNESQWREAMEVPYENAFQLQDMVAETVTRGLRARFSQDERDRIRADVPADPLAYEYYLRSKAYPYTLEGYRLATRMLEQAILLDSTYAPAFDELAHRRYRLATSGLSDYEEVERARQAYEKALSLNPELLTSLGGLSILLTETGNVEAAVDLIRRALDINPNGAPIHFALSHAYRYAGRLEDARQAAEVALALDPGNPRFRSIAIIYYYLQQYPHAIETARIDGTSTWAAAWQGASFLRLGRQDSAIIYFDHAIATEPDVLFGLWSKGMKAYATGNRDAGLAATRTLEAALAWDGEAWYHVASNYALLGDRPGSLRTLEQAIAWGYFNVAFMRADPFFDGLRDDPAYQQLLAQAEARHQAFSRRFFKADR